MTILVAFKPSGLTQAKCGLAHLTHKQKLTLNPLCIWTTRLTHIYYRFFKETLNTKVSLKTVFNNVGKKCANTITHFAGQLFLKFHQNKLRNKRAGDDLRCSKSLESVFSKQEISGRPASCA